MLTFDQLGRCRPIQIPCRLELGVTASSFKGFFMAALPYMQFYVADYLADTGHLTTEEHGAYLLLIFNYWQTGKPLRKDRLATVARMSNERWVLVERALSEFFHDDGETWAHFRIEADLVSVQESVDKASKAGKASAAARQRKKELKTNARSTRVQQTLNECSTDVPTPAQPSDQSKSDQSKSDQEKTTARGSRLPADWTLPTDWKTEARQIRPEWPDHHIQRVADGFKDYWLAKAGRDGSKVSWLATWRNWCRNDRSQITGVLGNGTHQNPLGGNTGKNRSSGSAFDKVINEINAARQRDGRTPMGNDDPALRPQVDQQLWGDAGPDGSVGGIIEGDFTRND